MLGSPGEGRFSGALHGGAGLGGALTWRTAIGHTVKIALPLPTAGSALIPSIDPQASTSM